MRRHCCVKAGFLMAALMTLFPFTSAQVSDAQVDALLAPTFRPLEPGCAALVMQNGKVAFRKGYGIAEMRTKQAVGPETNFRLASLSKQFTATAIMLLVHDGKLRYDDRLTDVFPDFPAYGKAISIRQVLNHTSGLLDYEDLMQKQYPGVPDEKIPQIRDAGVLALLEKQSTTKFAPGARWDYSNSGYVLLGLVVEKKSGMRFGDFLRERIFVPLGMSETVAYEKDRNEVRHRAYGHSQSGSGWRETDQSSTSATLGDGGIYTSLVDMEKWDRALSHHTLLTEAEMQPALTAPSGPDGAPLHMPDGVLAPGYGFGWFLDADHGHRRYWHYGETVGFRTAIQRFPDDHLSVIVLCNRSETDAPKLAESVSRLYLGIR